MGVCIPKQVVLTNSHLARLYYVMLFLTAAGMIAWFRASGGYLSSVSLREHVHLNMWVNAPTDEALSDSVLAMDEVCANPSNYDYWYDDHWHYNGSVCANVSSTCEDTNNCFRTRDIFAKEGPQQLWFTTHYKDSFHSRDRQSNALIRHFVPQANAFRVHFQYFFTAPRLSMFSVQPDTARAPADQEHRMTNNDVMTVFLDAQRDVAWVAEPGDSLNVSVPTLLELAGYPAQLTTPNPAWGVNLYPGATHPEGPVGLIGGMPLQLYIQCYRKPLPNTDLGEAHRHWTGPTCFVVVSGQEIWSTKYRTYPTASGMYDADMSGIRVTGDMDGTWEYFDVNNCILNFTALLVLLSLPKRIIVWVASRVLGHLSTIYRKAIFQEFVIAEEVAGITARIVTHGASFREVEQDDQYGGLTRSNLHDTLKHVSRYRMEREASFGEEEDWIFGGRPSHAKKTFDSTDVMLFSDFAFKAIVNPEADNYTPPPCARWLSRTRFGKVIEAILSSVLGEDFLGVQSRESRRQCETFASGPFPPWARQHHHESRISVDHFVSAAVSSELVDLDDLMWLFSVKRRIGRIERWFTPDVMAAHLIGETKAALEELTSQYAPMEALPSLKKEKLVTDGPPSSLASNCTVSNRDMISSLAENSHELHSELKLGYTTLIEQLCRVQTECDRPVGEGTRLGKELRVVQEAYGRQAKHIERFGAEHGEGPGEASTTEAKGQAKAEHIEHLRAEHGERRSPPTLTSESIERRLATANDDGSEAAVPASSSQVATVHDEPAVPALPPRLVQNPGQEPRSKSVPKEREFPNGPVPRGAEEASHQGAAREEDSGPTTAYLLHTPHLLLPKSALVEVRDDGSNGE